MVWIAQLAMADQVGCDLWLQRLSSERSETQPLHLSAPLTDAETLIAIECLLSARGDLSPARFGGATKQNVSQVLPPATIELAALYYISYLFSRDWQHASGVALWDDKGRINPSGAIPKAYSGYTKWLDRVKAKGLAESRVRRLNPLQGTGLRWYGN